MEQGRTSFETILMMFASETTMSHVSSSKSLEGKSVSVLTESQNEKQRPITVQDPDQRGTTLIAVFCPSDIECDNQNDLKVNLTIGTSSNVDDEDTR